MDLPDNITAAGSSVLVAMSGGVDSSVAAAMLLGEGFSVAGVYMITHDDYDADLADARAVAAGLGIELDAVDLRDAFDRSVVRYFLDEYALARTPNPCVYCNRHIKFGRLVDIAAERGFDLFATGHYIRIRRTGTESEILTGRSLAKDQSYILCQVAREALRRVIFPLGELQKEQVRDMAMRMKLPVHDKADSQEICFVPDDDYPSFLAKLRPQLCKAGDIVDMSGEVLGRHEGIFRYTIGQRRGLGVALGRQVYVVRLEMGSNRVVLGDKEDLLRKDAAARGFNWLTDMPAGEFRAFVKIRYNHSGQWATVSPAGTEVILHFEEPALSITPGQACAVYVPKEDGFQLLGGGWLE